MNGRGAALVAVARRWWPVPLILSSTIIFQKVVFESRYDVSGHAAGHLSSATAPFGGFAFVAILLWLTPTSRRQPDVLLACLAWLSATVLVLIGNVRVVNDLAGLSDARTEGLPDIADHDLANLAPWIGVLAALTMAAAFRRRSHVTRRAALGSSLLSILFPPWIIPGGGVLVLVGARFIAHQKSAAYPGGPGREISG